ncbi:MRS1 (YIR021W) and CCE1 (YKL011C) [Zygosaccharomyces parabailii]|uniref:BN860_18998g1_1 n=1 Tax=Zygosaccharomyces bailii (strain CLIB 213 / ATCC 58445 / CBS 680 / BCRC 21525 / NBRC 1098 / NCYC 1416 / NRRL Y-2227) TaxID=1333698 RepID=A0A8J2X5T4_ZYGB2|nr:MRS1 (YIR021W) and CCE1 (YKL011C) [Zygosaccharomyces parabailii]CDF87985.1 BN860_18998g1_1 [Zygosaccharomyces bailii CLIB 213]CDH12242.1 related to Cruciform cutting endonuclease 1,mitochondrial [Zygosaccharomyces bailii ISA1307]
MPKTPKTRSAIEALDLYCRKANGRTLKTLGVCIGANLGHNKTEARERIVHQAKYLEILSSCKSNNGVTTLTAIDTGVSNFAYSTFKWYKKDELPTLVDWNKIDLRQKFLPSGDGKMSIDPRDTFLVGHKLTEMFTAILPIPDMFTIERQRIRSQSSKTVLETVFMSNIMEQILYSNLKNKQIYYETNLKYVVNSSSPQRMVQYWCALRSLKSLLQEYKDSNSTSGGAPPIESGNQCNKTTKVIRINLVRKLLRGSLGLDDYKKCLLTPDWKTKIARQVQAKKKFKLFDCIETGPATGTRKDDDLADSFLHGLAWMQWLKTYEEITEITSANGGSFHQSVLSSFNKYCMELKTEWLNMSHATRSELAELQLNEASQEKMKRAILS